MSSMTSLGGKTPPTKQADLVTLPVVLHEELVASTDVLVEVPTSVKWADRWAIQNGCCTMRWLGLQSWLTTLTAGLRLRV